MREKVLFLGLIAVLLVLAHVTLKDGHKNWHLDSTSMALPGENTAPENGVKAPSINEILVRIGSHESFCWSMNGTSLSFFNVPVESLRACINYSNGSALYWVKTTDGRSFPYRVNATANDFDWSVVTHTHSPELNIMNFLSWVLQDGNVTDVKRAGNHYRFIISLDHVDESNAGTIENPHMIRIYITWNVTLIVNADGEPIGGHFVGKSRGPSNVVGANWFKEGNFTLLGEWKQ
ncbi:hypothetical protein [Thermococcus sp.]